MGLAGGEPSPAWPGGVQDTSTGHQAEPEPHLALFWGVLSPAGGAHPPKPALGLPEEQEDNWKMMFVFKDTDLTMPEPTTQTSSPQSRY